MANWDRVAASSGIAAVVLIAVGFASSGSSPSWTASGSTIAQSVASHHDSGLASVIIVGGIDPVWLTPPSFRANAREWSGHATNQTPVPA